MRRLATFPKTDYLRAFVEEDLTQQRPKAANGPAGSDQQERPIAGNPAQTRRVGAQARLSKGA
jgi:hypothetical protein